jgi:hypothetical protein
VSIFRILVLLTGCYISLKFAFLSHHSDDTGSEEVDTRRQLVAQRRGGVQAGKSELKVGGVMQRVHTGHAGGL